MRWLYHVLVASDLVGDPYAPLSLVTEGFVHASYQPVVAESARLYFEGRAPLVVLQIDPRALSAPTRVEVADTPRGPMPHIHGPIPRAAIRAVLTIAETAVAPDAVG